ncbi:hypothetical protein [Streptomyces sp. NBC_01423]|uniref:hypothetical protein n=1 Tax=Streptomyces sp. NBC_01423 TaxID=2903860 RepID=UPI002E28399F|nr:hypothetical protein [Streptomyces sp. NBC_01423]
MTLYVTVATSVRSAMRNAPAHAARIASLLPGEWTARVASSEGDITLAVRGEAVRPEEAREVVTAALEDPALEGWSVRDVRRLTD